MDWDSITNIILISAFAVFVLFICLGFFQWISRKSFTKIDPELRWATIPLILMTIVYFVFDHIFIWNTRPNGSGEPSFPSSHVMFVATLFAITAVVLPKYIKSKATVIFLDCLMLVLTILVAVGRVFANMHWVSDVIGALVFTAIFIAIYLIIIKKLVKPKTKGV
ncbi:MAG: phosphatase PAP2 family protein [Candidatus Saccharibacteria bacterium]|nr:phosphatase PAP2 family protein [Candidatus Saccharibacteria bacterium]